MIEVINLSLLILASLSGVGALVYFFLLRQLHPVPAIHAYPAFVGGYSAIIMGLTLARYLQVTGLVTASREEWLMANASICIGTAGCLGFGMLRFIAAFTGSSKHLLPGRRAWLVPIWSLTAAGGIWLTYFFLAQEWLTIGIPVMVMLGMLPISGVIALSLRALLGHYRLCSASKKQLIRFFILFFWLSVLLAIGESYIFQSSGLPLGSIMLPLCYTAWNIASLAWASRQYPMVRPAPQSGIIVDENRMDTFQFSPREKEIARLVARGLGNKEIAATLNLSANTTRNYVAAAFRKTGANNRVELLALLQRLNSTNVPSS